MSAKAMIGIGTLVALSCAAGAFYWLHSRNGQAFPEVVSAEPPGFHEAVPANPPASTPIARGSVEASAKKLPAPGDAEPSLRAGEVLDYTANVANLNNVATLRLKVAGKGNFSGKSAWHLQASAHTQNPLRMVFELDDQFDSYSDAATMASLQYEMHLSERGQKVESIQRMTATGKEPAPPDATEARVLPGTRDPLGMMQYLRNVDWTKTPNARCPVYDGHKLYDVRAKIAGTAAHVSVPAGEYAASRVDIRVFENGAEMKDASFVLYLANNAARTPVLLEAVMPFATARVELEKVK
ncbi:MAG: hypothetical protein DMG35_19075 [Acidobacteria bacterium]|nr:MAG: hypothetical protein DMG35_19075 [Acidobacteriota bacterium]